MIGSIKLFIKKIFPSTARSFLRRCKRHCLLFIKGARRKKTSLSKLRNILIDDLNLQKGDVIFVTSGFGYLNAEFTPYELIKLLQDIVTDEGIIMMPYYPPVNSEEWARSGQVFDMLRTRSGMGIMTNVFAQMPDVYMSLHPIKAVCVWGRNAEKIASNHNISSTPFYWDSPYGKLLKIGCKTLGVGVANNPMFHSIEDVVSNPITKYYLPNKFRLKLKTKDENEIWVDTFVHNSTVLSKCISSEAYIRTLNCNSYKKVDFGLSFIYFIDNTEVYDKVNVKVSNGETMLRQR